MTPTAASPTAPSSASAPTSTPPHTCRECGAPYDVGAETDGYLAAPYHYEQHFSTWCLGCFLGVGPNDLAAAEARYAELMDAQERDEAVASDSQASASSGVPRDAPPSDENV